MKRNSQIVALAILTAATASGCSRDRAVNAKLEKMSAQLDKIEQTLYIRSKFDKGKPPADKLAEKEPAPDTNVYAVPIDGDPFVGPTHAPVTVVWASEFACPFCQRARATVDQLRKLYKDDVKIVFKSFVVHSDVATAPALAACAAAKQGKYVEMAQRIWDEGFAHDDLSDANLHRIASESGLALPRYEADIHGAACKGQIKRDQDELAKIGTNGTPTFYINGRRLVGAQPIEQFKPLVDEALKKAHAALQGGAPMERYYTDFILRQAAKPKG